MLAFVSLLRREERGRRIPHVLGGQEHPLAQVAHEGARRDEAHHRDHAEPAPALERAIDVFELGQPARIEREPPGRDQVLFAGIALVERREVLEDGAPHLVLGRGVVDGRDGLAPVVAEGDGGDLVAPRLVGGVLAAGVIVGELDDLAREAVAVGEGALAET